MTVLEFYEWCKDRKLENAEMRISLKSAGLDMKDVPISTLNIDYGKLKEPHKEEKIFVRLG